MSALATALEIALSGPEHIALLDVLRERARQDTKWGVQNHSPVDYLAILVEEVGELAKEAVELRFGHHAERPNLRVEATQVAAVALAMLECIIRNNQGK